MEAVREMEKHSTSSVKRRRSTDNNQESLSTTCLFDDHKHKKVYSGDPFHRSISETVKRRRNRDNNQESLSATCSFDDHKHKKVDHRDPFALRDWVIGLDSAKFGSVTSEIEALFSSRTQILIPFLTRFPSLSSDSVNLKPGKDSLNVNDGTRHDANVVIVIDSDDDEPKCQRPFQPDPDVVLNNPTKQPFSMKVHDEANSDCQVSLHKCSGRDDVQGKASIGGGDTTASEPNVVGKDKSIEEDVDGQNDKSIDNDEVEGEDDNTIKDDDVEVEKKHDKGVYVGVQEDEPNVVGKDKSIEGDVDGQNDKSIDNDEVEGEDDNTLKDDDVEVENKHDKGVYVGVEEDEPNVVGKDKSIEDDVENKHDKGVHVGVEEDEPNVVGKDKSIEDDVGGQNDKSIEDDEVEVEDDNTIEDDDVEVENKHDKGVYVGVEEDEIDSESDSNFDGQADLWKEMSIGLESSMDMHLSSNKNSSEDEQECDHSYILKDDIGYVCRVCGLIKRSIDSIIEFQHPKKSKSIRTYYYEGQTNRSGDASLDGVKLPGTDFCMSELSVHPRHKKLMKPHQIEGFNFLLSNLVSENPGGCILAHAPGSGKTFLLISFIQSFMAKYPDARPLVILPKGILGTWKNEFRRWQIEELLLLDMYSVKSDGRAQQLEVLKKWANQRSILFLGYQQFSSIVCDDDISAVSTRCQEILLTRPSLLILDEGHTPRNKETNISTSLDKVETPNKVVLSGTLYQNHVTEVFNILNLVRPKFLKMEKSKVIKRRILSMVKFKSHIKKGTDNEFYELVEHTLLKDDNFKRKVAIIEDLRKMTSSVLHYYKGDLLDELPGLVDFSIFLKLTLNQKREVSEIKKVARNNPFKVSSGASAIYVHPGLKPLIKTTGSKEKIDDGQIDKLLEKLDETEGVKAKFYMNMLNHCESVGEKLLVFSQYLLPLKFLVRLTAKTKGWSVGKQIFVITGDHDNDEREKAMDKLNNSTESRVFFGSIRACGEGISLVGASRIIILDVPLNPSVTRQAIGRAFRPGQMKKVYTYRLIAAESPEEEDHATSFKKETVAKMWFEWNEYCGHHDFEMQTISVKDCGDQFLETSFLNEDITAISKR